MTTERAAVHKDRNLRRPSTMCIRDYIQLLEQQIPGLNRNLCRFYLETYEKARFRYPPIALYNNELNLC